MATVTVSYGALNMSKGFPFAITHSGQVVTLTASPTQIHVLLGGANFANYNGAFQFFGNAIVSSSTLSSYQHHAASLGYTLNLSSFITAGDYFGFLDSGNAVGLRDLILSGNDALTGAAGNDVLIAGLGADTVDGGVGNDRLDGGGDVDSLIGGAGNDSFVYDGSADAFIEDSGAGSGIDTVLASQSYSLSGVANIENITLTGILAIDATGNELGNFLLGNAAANHLSGAEGNDTLDGGAANDTLQGGEGNDVYLISSLDDELIDSAGVDEVRSSINYTLGADIENLTLTGGAVNATGNDAGNVLAGNALANLIDGGAGADTMNGGLGSDTYIVDNLGDVVNEAGAGVDLVKSSVSYTLGANVENLLLIAGSGNIDATGNSLANVLTGNEGDNVLAGLAGNDRLVGGAGNDTYVVSGTDTIVELAGGGTSDTVQSAGSYSIALLAQLENITLTGLANVSAIGNGVGNVLTGNGANNLLSGGAGDDTLVGAGGNDTLDGGTGADSLSGGLGNDLFIFGSADDIAAEGVGEGIDTVRLAFSAPAAIPAIVVLADNVENLQVLGTGLFDVTGNDLDNLLVGNASANTLQGGLGDDTLDGGAGPDSMSGGDGNDLYVLSMASDEVSESGASDTSDTVRIAYSVAVATIIDLGIDYDGTIENLQITGAGAFRLTGNAADNILTGNASANLIDGAAGADTMNGGLGGDTYVVDNLGDVVNEAGVGVDLVKSSVSYTLGANVENLLLTGSANIDGTGNGLANVLTGNEGDNVLAGLAGNDRLVGGAGNDTYVVLGTDTIVELAGGGTSDTVQSATSYSIALLAQVENLELTGGANINATGNAGMNELTGNSGNNLLLGGAGNDTLSGSGGNDTLDGGLGDDSLSGGLGDDLFVLNSEADQVFENLGEGSDTVRILYAPLDNTLDLTSDFGGNIENVEVLPARAVGNFTAAKFFEIVGNAADNRLSGNGQVSVLSGGDGNDTLSTGFGNGQNMIGGAGADQFVFDTPYRDTTTSFAYVNFNAKFIQDFEPGIDRIALDNDFFPRAALGELDPAAFVSGAGLNHALDSSDRVIYDTTTGNLYYDFDGSAGTGVPWLFATLSSGPTISASDFEIIN